MALSQEAERHFATLERVLRTEHTHTHTHAHTHTHTHTHTKACLEKIVLPSGKRLKCDFNLPNVTLVFAKGVDFVDRAA